MYFLALGGPKYVKCPVVKFEWRSVHILGPEEKIIDDRNYSLSENTYHICLYVTKVKKITPKNFPHKSIKVAAILSALVPNKIGC